MTPEELEKLIAELTREGEDRREIDLDRIGEALGLAVASTDEIDRVMGSLEARGIRVVAPEGGGGERKLAEVLKAARVLRTKLGRAPNVREIAEASGLSEGDVRHALELSKVMGR